MKQFLSRIFVIALAVLVPSSVFATTTSRVINSDLQMPSKLLITPAGNLLVAENGTGANAGRVSLVDRLTGQRRTVLGGLPAGVRVVEEPPAPSGPTGIFLDGNTLYLVVGEGDTALAGPAPGTAIANPAPSPHNSSLYAFVFPTAVDSMTQAITLLPSHLTALDVQNAVVDLGNGVTGRLIADFPDSIVDPRPGVPNNIRASNPYGVTRHGSHVYVADASMNSIVKVDPVTGTYTTLTTFPPFPNPNAGPPVIEAVPDSIRVDGNRLLVTLLTGFPFAEGLSRAVAVDPSTGAVTPVVTGLNSAIDIAPITTGGAPGYITAEFSTDLQGGVPGRIRYHRNDGTHLDLVSSILTPTSIAVDQKIGYIFVTQLATGSLTLLDAHLDIPLTTADLIVPVVARVQGKFGAFFDTSMQLVNPTATTMYGVIMRHRGGPPTTIPYEVPPFTTQLIDNIMDSPTVPDILGVRTIDIAAVVGPLPTVVTRIYDKSRSAVSTGAYVEAVTPEMALRPGDRASLPGAANPELERMNIGVRALGAGVKLVGFAYTDGILASRVEWAIGPNQLVHTSIQQFFATNPGRNDVYLFEVTEGAAIVYGATVNNDTQENSFIRAFPLPR